MKQNRQPAMQRVATISFLQDIQYELYINTAGGSCSSCNIIYVYECKLCQEHYVGRSTRPLRTILGEHRRSFHKLFYNKDYDEQ